MTKENNPIQSFECPECGTKFNISEVKRERKPQPRRKSATDRLEALKKAGVDVSNLFAMKAAGGDEYIGRVADGKLCIVTDDDPLLRSILDGGTVPNRSLFRRWIMSQMFYILDGENMKWGGNFTRFLSKMLPYRYTWKTLVDELDVQAKMHGKDNVAFAERNRWFNKRLAVEMAEHHINELVSYVGKLPIKHCKGQAYKHVFRKDIFCTCIDRNIRELNALRFDIGHASTPCDLARAVRLFRDKMIALPHETAKSAAWVDAFKGNGAYFTLQNLIRFHNCFITTEPDGYNNRRSEKLWGEAGIRELDRISEKHRDEGWYVFGLMKSVIKDNGVNIKAERAEWARSKYAE